MNRNSRRIADALKGLTERPFEITTGTMVDGSLDEDAATISVQPPGDDATVIHDVMLGAVDSSTIGLMMVPENGSNVVIGSMDGPGSWTVLKADKLASLTVSIDHALVKITGTGVTLKNGTTVLEIGSSAFKMKTGSENMYQLLKDLITALTSLTVTTSTGPSSVPINVATFTTLLTRLNNLLNA